MEKKIDEWWPDRLDLRILRQNSQESNPYGKDFDYQREFSSPWCRSCLNGGS